MVLLGALGFVVWRQTRALEGLADLSQARSERALALDERADLELRIQMLETSDEDADLARLQRVFQVLKAHPGRDTVRLKLVGGQPETDLDPNMTISCDSDLVRALTGILGPKAVDVE